MANYHLNAKIISRAKGQSAIAAAAYRSGQRLYDEKTGEVKSYTRHEDRVIFTGIMAPDGAGEWVHDRQRLWNEVERVERRKDAQLAREFEVSLPHELTPDQREMLIKEFARNAFVKKRYVVDIAIHAPYEGSDQRNYHAHLLVTMRRLSAEGWSHLKDRSLNSRDQLYSWRREWAEVSNRHLERRGFDVRVDHRSLADQGIAREPTIHVGYAAAEIQRRGGHSDRVSDLRAILSRNELRIDLGSINRRILRLEGLAALRRSSASAAGAWSSKAGMVHQQRSAYRAVQNLDRTASKWSSAPRAREQMQDSGARRSDMSSPQESRGRDPGLDELNGRSTGGTNPESRWGKVNGAPNERELHQDRTEQEWKRRRVQDSPEQSRDQDERHWDRDERSR